MKQYEVTRIICQSCLVVIDCDLCDYNCPFDSLSISERIQKKSGSVIRETVMVTEETKKEELVEIVNKCSNEPELEECKCPVHKAAANMVDNLDNTIGADDWSTSEVRASLNQCEGHK